MDNKRDHRALEDMNKDVELLEKKIEIKPIHNPAGPNRQATQELIDTLSTVPESSLAYNYTQEMIKAVKAGYEEQSGENFDQS
jgi:hypothetical protein